MSSRVEVRLIADDGRIYSRSFKDRESAESYLESVKDKYTSTAIFPKGAMIWTSSSEI